MRYLLLVLFPVTIFVWATIARAIINFTMDSDSWWGFPLYMSSEFCLAIIGILLLILIVAEAFQ